jgi:hypothetical protein
MMVINGNSLGKTGARKCELLSQNISKQQIVLINGSIIVNSLSNYKLSCSGQSSWYV